MTSSNEEDQTAMKLLWEAYEAVPWWKFKLKKQLKPKGPKPK